MPLVDILLATHNGAKFLPEQLASLEVQTYENWRLILRDDGSSDGSADVVRDWAAQTGRELLVVEDGQTRLGAGQSFGRLLARSDAPYFAFCDQDDVWRPSKIERLVVEMKAREAELGENVPLLVHCDLAVVRSDLEPLEPSFWAVSNIEIASIGQSDVDRPLRMGLMLQNVVTGCAALGNAELRRQATPVPNGAYLHDWWVGLIAACLGELRGIYEPLVDYRQHGGNSVGAKAWDAWSIFKRLITGPSRSIRRTRDSLARRQQQAACFMERFADALPVAERLALAEFAALPQRGLLYRKTFMVRHRVYPQSRLQGLILLFLI